MVGDKYVVTAAHCVYDKYEDSKHLFVKTGITDKNAWNSTPGSQLIPVKKINVHPKYVTLPSKNDIAVLELENTVDFKTNPYVKPACLPYKSLSSDFIGKMFTSTNWEKQMNKNDFPLEEVKLEMLGKDCGGLGKLSSDQFCADILYGTMDKCKGENGGPAVVSDVNNKWALTLIGVQSFQQKNEDGTCGMKGSPAVLTDVSFFMQNGWLMDQLPNLKTCPNK